ncbi:MAG: hypothetical protein ACI9YE_001933, partial [Psychroserpens sp.]
SVAVNFIKMKLTILCFYFISCFSYSQTITGIVLDATTNLPIE